MKIALVANDFYPLKDGISHTLTSICKIFQNKENVIYVFNRYYKGKNSFDLLDKYNYKLRDIIKIFLNKKLLILLIKSVLTISRDDQIPSTEKLLIFLYLCFRPKVLLKTLININNTYSYFRKYDFDLILGGGSGVDTLPLVFLLSRIFNKKVITFAHGNEFFVRTTLSLRSFYLKHLDKIIVHTKKLKNLVTRIHHLDKDLVEILTPGLLLDNYKIGISREDLRKEFNLPEDAFILLSVGRHISRKKFDLVIYAIKKIKELNPSIKIKYVLIGKGPDTGKLKEIVQTLKLDDDVIFLGKCSNLKRNKFYKLSDIFVMPSITGKETIEGFGVVFLEANFFKIPVIGAYSGGMSESIINAKTGFLVKPNDLTDLVEKILYLYNNKEIREKMGEFGHNRVKNEFSWENLYHKYVKLFNKVIT